MGFTLNLSKPLALVGVIVGAVVTMLLLAAFIGVLIDSGRAVTENLTTADTGSDTADTLATALAFIVPIALILAIIGLAIAAVQFSRK